MTKKLDVSNHVLVPKHEKMAEPEVQKLLDKYDIHIKQLPRILITDPALRDLDVKVGDIIRIKRTSPIIGEVDFFRMVTNG